MRRVLLALLLAAVGPAPKPVVFTFRLSFTSQAAYSGSLRGTFTASGAVVDSGRVLETYTLSLPRLRDQQPVQTVRARSTLTGRKGTITSTYEGVVSAAGPSSTVTEGRWAIVGGTARYRGAQGHGRFSAIVDLTRRTMTKRYDGVTTAR